MHLHRVLPLPPLPCLLTIDWINYSIYSRHLHTNCPHQLEKCVQQGSRICHMQCSHNTQTHTQCSSRIRRKQILVRSGINFTRRLKRSRLRIHQTKLCCIHKKSKHLFEIKWFCAQHSSGGDCAINDFASHTTRFGQYLVLALVKTRECRIDHHRHRCLT